MSKNRNWRDSPWIVIPIISGAILGLAAFWKWLIRLVSKPTDIEIRLDRLERHITETDAAEIGTVEAKKLGQAPQHPEHQVTGQILDGKLTEDSILDYNRNL